MKVIVAEHAVKLCQAIRKSFDLGWESQSSVGALPGEDGAWGKPSRDYERGLGCSVAAVVGDVQHALDD
jgi:hypothetical protein